MAYVVPATLTERAIDAGESKSAMATRDVLIRAFMAGAILGLSTAFAATVSVNTGQPLLGALLFPVGFCLLYLLGFDLLTGVFTLVPLAWLDRRPGVTLRSLLRIWGLVFVGNLLGALTVAIFMAISFTYGFSSSPNEVGEAIANIGSGRLEQYSDHGAAGMLTLFTRAVMCNWMVSTGVFGAMMSDSLGGKVIAMWMPVVVFFYLGFEHSVVNMFLFPSALLLGGDFNVGEFLFWNEVPTLLGNLVGGLTFVGLVMYTTHARPGPVRR